MIKRNEIKINYENLDLKCFICNQRIEISISNSSY